MVINQLIMINNEYLINHQWRTIKAYIILINSLIWLFLIHVINHEFKKNVDCYVQPTTIDQHCDSMRVATDRWLLGWPPRCAMNKSPLEANRVVTLWGVGNWSSSGTTLLANSSTYETPCNKWRSPSSTLFARFSSDERYPRKVTMTWTEVLESSIHHGWRLTQTHMDLPSITHF